MSDTAQKNNIVQVHYKGTLSDGSVFDSSEGRDPLEFQVGAGQMIEGFDKAVEGMKKGDTKTVTIPSAEAYGDYNEELIQAVPKTALPDDLEVTPGMQLQSTTEDGYPLIVTVKEVRDDEVVLDANHGLAGEDLTFEINLVEIQEAS